jgi:curved DNA-binding protein CbpA
MIDTRSNSASKGELPREALYRDWLGIKVTAPSYYALLGLPELDDNDEAVQKAARDVKRKLRAYQIGMYRGESLDMLAEVGQAVSVLTNPEKKRAYDADLEKRWRTTVEETYATHCEGAGRDSGVLEAWLVASATRGVPVARLMPRLVATLGPRIDEWPTCGESHLPLPAALAIYREAVVLGQCLRSGSLDRRVDAVKRVQQLLGISEGLARPVIEEVARGPHVFATLRIVKRAQVDPDGVLVRLGRRIRRWGGQVGPRGKVLAALAMLLGKHKRDYERALRQLDEPPVELTPAQSARSAARRQMQETSRRAREVRHMTQQWVVSRPQLLLGAAVAVGIVFVIVVMMVGGGQTPSATPSTPPPSASSVPSTPVRPHTAAVSPAESVPADATEFLKDYIKKYPAAAPEPDPVVPPLEIVKPPVKGAVAPNDGVISDFFGVKGKKATSTTGTP